MMKYWIFVFFLISQTSSALDARQLADPKLQENYELLTKELRCLVCQNQTIADSNAELAFDLRRQVSEMLEQGKSNDEIIQFMTDRYGDFVLYKPAFKGKTLLLWIAPGAFLVLGLIIVYIFIRQKRALRSEQGVSNNELKLDIDKQNKIRRLLEKGDQS